MSEKRKLRGKHFLEDLPQKEKRKKIPLKVGGNEIYGTLWMSESYHELSGKTNGKGLLKAGRADTSPDLVQQLILEQKQLEIEDVSHSQVDHEGKKPPRPPKLHEAKVVDDMEHVEEIYVEVEAKDERYAYALLVKRPNGLLHWVKPAPKLKDETSFYFRITASKTKPVGGKPALAPEKGSSVFSLFRWLREKVIRKLSERYGFHQFRFDEKKEWKKMEKSKDWQFLRKAAKHKQRTLLLIHGFLGNRKSFSDFLEKEASRLQPIYGNRIFSFSHPTLLRDVNENALQFFKTWERRGIPPGLRMDVLTRSRGSLVFRQIAEKHRSRWSARKVKTGKIIMLAGPNEGTPLAKKENVDKLLNVLTNVAWTLPVLGLKPVIYILRLSFQKKKHRLKGLFSMSPEEEIVKDLNGLPFFRKKHKQKRKNYYSLSVNSKPSTGIFKKIVKDIIKPIFGEMDNDLINPTHGVYGDLDKEDKFEIENKVVDPDTRNINHLNYFKHDSIRNQIMDWLESSGG